MSKEYCVLRYRSDDGVHKKGDVQYVSQSVLYVGQTPECRLRLPDHPDYEDACYAVIIRNQDGSGWRIVRQEKDASISINGVPLKLAAPLGKNDRLSFDNTNLVFDIEAGDVPVNQYVEYKTAGWVRFSVILMFIILAGIAFALYRGSRSTMTLYKAEVQDICRIEADRLMVLSDAGDTLEIISAPRTFVGTGFITDGGYFVTARHCVEFWLSLEGELKPDIEDIDSDIVRRAIEAETDPSIHLVSVLKITSYDGTQSWKCTSEDFIMDKTRDNLYDYGGFESGYIWRSVVSMYEKRDAELGDVAVMKWKYGDGCIALESDDVIHETGTALCAFGYPQNEERREAVFALDEGNVYQQKETPYECFICTKGFDQGFSGGPVFAKKTKSVVGIVSRSSDSHTLVVPVSQIHRLISERENRWYCMLLASDIKGYCTVDACWRFMHDVASRMAECHAEGRYCRLLRLLDVVIDDDAFRISDDAFCDQGSAESDVWMLAAAAFELILGTPVFNGLGEKCQKAGTPVPNLPDKEMTALNDLLRRCLQKDASKRPNMHEVKSVASDELQKCMSRRRAQRICPVNACSVPDGEYDIKWPEAMTVVKKMIICVLLVVIGAVPSFSQSVPDLQEDAYVMELMEVSKMLRSRNESIWEEAQSRMGRMLEVFTLMDELRDVENDCALVGNSVTSFGLNRMISMLKRTNTVMQNTGKGLLDGTDLRYHYSIYEKGVRKGSTATYDGLSGRTGRQVFIIIPYSADQPYETELSLTDGKTYHPVHKDKDGISYYVIDAEEGPGDDDVLTLKVRNNDMQNNRSFVIINHNYRNK